MHTPETAPTADVGHRVDTELEALIEGFPWTEYDTPEDPGAEVIDLDGGQALTADDEPQLMGFMSTGANAARLATDYEWSTWLAACLRNAGLSVVEHPGWKTRGRPRSAGPFKPRGLVIHHDASAIGPSPAVANFIAVVGRPKEGIPAPLSQLWVCMGCRGKHPVGTWHVLAAGRANHAGVGAGWGAIARDSANTYTWGVEMDNTTGEPTPAAMLRSLETGSAAILRRTGASPAKWLCGHKEFARGRKVDPDDVDMRELRRDVARIITGKSKPAATKPPAKPAPKPRPPAKAPARKPSKADTGPLVPFPGQEAFHKAYAGHGRHAGVRKLRRWLKQSGFAVVEPHGFKDHARYTDNVRKAVKAYELSRPQLRDDANGYAGAATWASVQRVARKRRR